VHLRRARHARGAVKRGLDGRQRVAGAPGRHHARGRQRVLAGGQGYGRSGVRREVPGRRCRQGLPHPARVGASVRSGLARREAGASQGLVATFAPPYPRSDWNPAAPCCTQSLADRRLRLDKQNMTPYKSFSSTFLARPHHQGVLLVEAQDLPEVLCAARTRVSGNILLEPTRCINPTHARL